MHDIWWQQTINYDIKAIERESERERERERERALK